jgi:hypothetical protein
MEAPSEKCGFICRESLAEKREEAMTEGARHMILKIRMSNVSQNGEMSIESLLSRRR